MLFDLQIFSGGVYPPSGTSRTISFLFPIVFGINAYYRKRRSASYTVREVRIRWEREREREPVFSPWYGDTERDRRKWRHLSSAESGEEFCTFLAPKSCPLVSSLLIKWRRLHTFPLPETVHSSKQFAFFVKFALFGIVLPVSNSVTRDRSTETSDLIFGCTALLLIEKLESN